MKRTKWMLTMMVMVLSGIAAAQLSADQKIVAQVPFEFVVANRIVPAGQCIVQPTTSNAMTLMIHNVGAAVDLFASTLPGENKKASAEYALVFNHYGSQYFLSGIKLRGSRITYRLPEGKAEAELRAQNASGSEEVVLASLQ